MRFDDDSQLDTSQVQDTRGRGGFPRRGGVAIGGGAGLVGVILFILIQLLGGGMVVLVLLARPEGLGSFLRRPAPVPTATIPEREVVITRLSGRTANARLKRAIPALVLEEGVSR